MPPDPPGFNGSGAPAAAITDLAARLDRIPVITPTHRRWAGLLGFLFVFDLVDLNSIAYAAPALRIAAWVARLVVPTGPGAWRWIFVVGALGAVGGVVALRTLPESATLRKTVVAAAAWRSPRC